ncbi:beta strand repeat-containing protein [Leptolyngbya ectocarpi]|uniref:beta strand repeat-containing protein n=1 Tax=Leptolyngbya ectocarpi TaxID=1202 RepID=UPI001D1499A8|nr:hypothetical protein [Leptolyngbya ectocarpi]
MTPEGGFVLANGDPQLSEGRRIIINGEQEPTLDIRAGTLDFAPPGSIPELENLSGFIPIPPLTFEELNALPSVPASASIDIDGDVINNTFIPSDDGDRRGQIYLSNQYNPNPFIGGNTEISVNSITAFGNSVTIDSIGDITIPNGISSGAAEGPGGDVILLSVGDINTVGGEISAFVNSSSAGDIILRAYGSVTTSGIRSEYIDFNDTDLPGFGGDIEVVSIESFIESDGNYDAKTEVGGRAGDIWLEANGDIVVRQLNSESLSGDLGDAGNITISSQTGKVETDGIISSTTGREGFELLLPNPLDPSKPNIIVVEPNSGNVNISANGSVVTDFIRTSSVGGFSGNISINSTTSSVETGNLTTTSQDGVSGNITLNAVGGDGFITTNSITSSTNSSNPDNDSGEVNLDATGQISTGLISTTSNAGNSGDVIITSQVAGIRAGFLSFFDGSFNGLDISSSSASGDAGDIILEAGNIVFENGELIRIDFNEAQNIEVGNINSGSGGIGEDGGKITLITEGGEISADNLISENTSKFRDDGSVEINTDGGSIELNAFGNISTGEEIRSSSDLGESGSVEILSYRGSVSIGTNGLGSIETRSEEAGANFVSVNAFGNIKVGDIDSEAGGEGSGFEFNIGDITLESVNGQISTGNINSSTGISDLESGSVEITAPDKIKTGSILTFSSVNGDSGDILLRSRGDGIEVSGELRSSTQEGGIAGNITLDAEGSVDIFNNVLSNGFEGSGLIHISTTENLDIQGVDIRSETRTGSEQAAGVEIFAPSLELSNVNISATTQNGVAGDVTINQGLESASSVSLQNGSSIRAQQTGDESDSRAGNVIINAQSVSLKGDSRIVTSNVSSRVDDSTQESFGNINFENLNTLEVENSVISASTERGVAGSVTVNASDSIELSGIVSKDGLNIGNETFERGGILAVASDGGTAGNLVVSSNSLDIDDQAVIAVSSPTGVAGTIDITANNIDLTRGASIRSETGDNGSNPNSGDINITLDGPRPIFWMRHGERNFGEINASGNGSATGGTITIGVNDDAGFIIAIPSEDSDIITEADQGDGGKVRFGGSEFSGRTLVLGLRERPQDTFLSDIVVASDQGASGIVGFSDPINEGFLELEEELLLPSSPNLDEGCQIGTRERQAEFFDYGLGGAPPGPDELMGGGNILTEWIPLDLAETYRRLRNRDDVGTASSTFNTVSVGRGIDLLSLCSADDE